MKRIVCIASLLTALAVTAMGQVSPPPTLPTNDLMQCIVDLAAEVTHLRLELLEQRLERQELVIAQLHGQAETVNAEQQRVEELERSGAREVAELDERLIRTGVGEEERKQLEQLRIMAMTSGQQYLSARRASIAQDETKINQQLKREQQKLQSLVDSATRLKSKIKP